MRGRRIFGAAACVLSVVGAGCGHAPAARIGGDEISRSAFESELSALRANTAYIARREQRPGVEVADARGTLTPVFVAEVLSNSIISVAMSQEARRRDLAVTASDRAWARDYAPVSVGNPKIFALFPPWFQRLAQRRAAVVASLHRVLKGNLTLQAYYAANRARFVKACSYHILVPTREEALAARKRILSGEAFAAVAREVSIDAGTGPKGGDLGCNGRGDLAPPLDEAAFSQPVREAGPPIETGDGFHLILVSSRRAPPLERITGELEAAIHSAGTRELQALIRNRLRSTSVEVSEEFGHWDPRRLAVVPA